MEFVVIFLLCGIVLSTASQTHTTNCVKPASSALPLSCETLESYASNVSQYFRDNTSFVFLPGIHVLSNISIHHVSNVVLMASAELDEGNVTIQCNGSGGLVFQHVSNVVLANLAFVSCGQPLPLSLQREGETAQAALAFGEVTNLVLESVLVSDSRGFGVLGHCVHGDFNITNSILSSNKGAKWYLGGNAAIEYTNCTHPEKHTSNNLHISSCQFINGGYERYSNHTYSGTLATGLALILSQTNTTVLIEDVLMQGNRNNIIRGIGGNLFIHFYNETNFTANAVTITNSRFLYGEGQIGAGIGATFYTPSQLKVNTSSVCNNSLVIQNSDISHNTGIVGGGLYYEFQMKYSDGLCPYASFVMFNCTLNNNSIVIPPQNPFRFTSNGVALQIVAKYHKNLKAEKIPDHYQLLFDGCTFTNSHLVNSTDQQPLLALPNVMTVLIENTDKRIKFHNCDISDNTFAGLGIFNSMIEFDGTIEIVNNTGTNGGGIMLCESSFIYLSNQTTVHIVNNHATQAGGGIYVEKQCFGTLPFCFYQLWDTWHCNERLQTRITMTNNTASFAGDHIYGGSLDNCKINDCKSKEVFRTLFQISPYTTRAVTSSPRSVCVCSDGVPTCDIRSYNSESVYPGESINVQVAIFGQMHGFVPGTLVVYSSQKQQIMSQTVNKLCQTLEIKVTGTGSSFEEFTLQMSSAQEQTSNNTVYLSVNDKLHIHIPIKSCPWGFNYSKGICGCDKILPDSVQCDISTSTILMLPPAWIGFINETHTKGIIYHELCPYGYCVNEDTEVTSNGEIFDQDVQCAANRTGLLCSKCVDDFSLNSDESSDCVMCKNKVGISVTVLGYGLFGLLLIVLLLVLNITITDGMISGLLFYSNIVNLDNTTFLPSHNHNALTVVISWINFSKGYNSCFYNGMDAYAKAWLCFIFPVYLFSITAGIIGLVRKSSRVARLLGKNIIKVLATLFLLFYSKLIEAVVRVLSFTLIRYPGSNNHGVHKIVWLPDPTVEYFSGKHIPLALVAIVLGVLIVAFTMVLLCVQPLQRYSHLRCFTWMAKLKPFIDAYTAPHIIKDNCRYWEGLLLLFRLILALLFSFNNVSKGKLNENLYPLSLLCVLLLTISWSTGGIYNKLKLNILNLTSILNLGILALLLSFVKDRHVKYTYQSNKFTSAESFRKVTYSSFSVQVFLLVLVLFYHTYMCVLSWHLRYKRFKYRTLAGDSTESLPPLRRFPLDA